MKKVLLFITILCFAKIVSAQTNIEKESIRKTISTFFDGMKRSDTLVMRAVMAGNMVLQSVSTGKDGTAILITEKPGEFLKMVAKTHDQVYDERVIFGDMKIDGALAAVWAPYKFYLGTQFSHCGVDVFQLAKIDGAWKIIYIADTRRKDDCP